MPLPPAPYDACDKRTGRVSSLSLVRCRGNDYSVPVAYGHREVLIRCSVDEVVISCGAEVIARHRRSYDSEDLIFDPLHYLPLIEQKIGALDQAAPLAGWDLPGVCPIVCVSDAVGDIVSGLSALRPESDPRTGSQTAPLRRSIQ